MPATTARTAALSAIAATTLWVSPTAAQAHPVLPKPPAVTTVSTADSVSTANSMSAVIGLGQIRLSGPNVAGDPVWFGIEAFTDRTGSAHGRFRFRHERPDGTVVGDGWAEVTCLRVTGDVALLTAVVPDGVGVVKNHAYYMKVTDGGSQPDQLAFVQAQNGTERPPTRCVDFDVEHPGLADRSPVYTGGFTILTSRITPEGSAGSTTAPANSRTTSGTGRSDSGGIGSVGGIR
ncbi:hypothetical protein ACWT_3937 [Actinoplanes sp. SE50]|uniref:hypothetical protein n=1 Tax=unclassified Actinoplanes TaxID=2626549 RepID=UPI00023ED257|nr:MULTISPECIES: hypothetical protein [unclassified Actinoplanes]AEV84961.1 hypothetical protein ACPL_4066 [Actinoplanes sp. SE50/110]ATO83352.1 hypothetical protein ACWT_3937 [Actinoplanes sp. SE50]SLM00759.1 hypothetical protein ACSP50_3992 [Actinoplanes sp. SE50/110]